MAYDHGQIEHMIAKDASLASLAIIGEWSPGYQPWRLRAAALVFTVTAGAAGEVEINHRPTAGSQSSEVALDAITFDGTTGAQGKVRFVELTAVVRPGEEVSFEVIDVAATGTVHCILFFEPSWENPLNNTRMTNVT